MDPSASNPDRDIAARDAAIRRLRRLRLTAGVVATAAMGVIAGVTAAATHTRVVVTHALTSRTVGTSTVVSVPEPAATVNVSSGVAASSPSAAAAPTAASSAPVAVSGGS